MRKGKNMERYSRIGAGLLALLATACGPARGPENGTAVGEGNAAAAPEERDAMRSEVKRFVAAFEEAYEGLETKSAISYWKAANSGVKADFEAYADAELAKKTFLSDPEMYGKITGFLENRQALDPLDVRVLEVAMLAFKGNQLPKETLEALVDAQSEIEQIFNTFRGDLNGERMTNNALLEALKDETDTLKRKAIWEALKQVGGAVSDKLIALAVERNAAARRLGYRDFFEMEIRLQEHDPATLDQMFDALEAVTDGAFGEMKTRLDRELAERFDVSAGDIRPWHYDNPFFQAAPPSKAVDPDRFYEGQPKEQIMAQAAKFFNDIGLSADAIIARSDLYEREGKDQHAFCISIDRKDDVRTLLNIQPTAAWMDTALHEEGHGIYYVNIDRTLPYTLREASHILTTEGIAMLFGALAYNPTWLVEYGGADPAVISTLEAPLLEQRRREQLIFARWAMVMYHFEKALYRDPGQDLNTRWWDLVERFQRIPRPEGRDAPDWASKPHFTIAPVYYHNYLLGEVFAAQLRHVLATMAGHEGSTAALSFNGQKAFGRYLREEVFAPGMSKPWPKFVEDATGEPLTVKYYGEEIAD